MLDPTVLLSVYQKLAPLPGGRRVFSRIVGTAAPYTGTLPFLVEDLGVGHSRIRLYDRRIVRNHLKSIHAIALMNLGEVSTGLATYASLPRGSRGIITDLGMSYLKKARGPIVASCEVEVPTGSGRQDLQVEAVLRNSDGVDVALARATWRIDVP